MCRLIQYQILEQLDGLRPPSSCSRMLLQMMPLQYVYGLTGLSGYGHEKQSFKHFNMLSALANSSLKIDRVVVGNEEDQR